MGKNKMDRTNALRLLKIIHSHDKFTLPVSALEGVSKSLLPLTTLFVSSMVISGLEGGTAINELILKACVGSGAVFLLACIRYILEKYHYIHYFSEHYLFDFAQSKKSLHMDYQTIDSESTQVIRQRMSDDRRWGDGIGSLVRHFGDTVQNACLAAVSLCVTMPLFFALPGFSGALWTAAFIAGVIGVTLLSLFYVKAANTKAWGSLSDTSREARVFNHFIFDGINYKFGKDIRIFKVQNLIEKYGAGWLSSKFLQSRRRSGALFGRSAGISSAVTGVIQGAAYLYVALQAMAGNIDIGSVFFYAGAIYQFSNGLSSVMVSINEFFIACGRMESSLEFFDIPDVLYKGTLPVEKRTDNRYELEFHNVSFKYPGSDAWALRDFSLKLRVGERMAVVGMNGSGKTTMIKLLCRLYDPTEGIITLNGIDIRKYNYEEYLSIFSVVFQDFTLFSFPLGQNVAASTDVDAMRTIECLNKVGFSQRLGEMPQGLDTCLYKDFEDGGVEISGGEAQKIALARALYKNAPFIILDEPTAALDPIAEFEIYSKFNEIVGEKTAVYISHRLSSCRFCQDIAVFHEGELVQRGSHDQLIADRAGKYYELWNAQAQYYTTVA